MIDAVTMLHILSEAQNKFISRGEPRLAFDDLLTGLLTLTDSEYGFIGEVLRTSEGAPYLKTYAITNIAWDDATRKFYTEKAPVGMEFFNLDSLFGEVMKTGETVIANDPATDPRRTGIPEGHPPLNAFMGIPIYRGNLLIGMAGIANRPDGYSPELAQELLPFIHTCANLISAYRYALDAESKAKLLLNSENRHRAVFETVIDGIITIDEQGIVTGINPAAEKIFGYKATEVIGRNVKMLMPAHYAEKHDGYLSNYAKTGQAHIIGKGRQVEGLRKNGSRFPLELAVSEMQVNDERMYTGVVRDISENLEAALTIQSSVTRLQAVLDNVVDGIITIDKKGIIDHFNPAAEKIFGYTLSEVIGRNVSILMPEPYTSQHDQYLENYLTTGDAHIIGIGREVIGKRKDGATFPMDLAVSKMRIGDEIMFSGIVRDITERKRMETMKNEFISTVSHELRTPLTSIRGSLDLVTGGAVGALPAEAMEMLKIAANNTERLLILINDILDIQKIESGKMAFRFETLNLKEFLQQAVSDNQAYADQYGVRFVINSAHDNQYVFADRDRLMQVMANLLSNAAKFSPRDDVVEINTARHVDAIRISVTDHGAGIPDDFKPVLFDKFTQSDSSDSRQKGGTGLGLNIAKLIIEKHGGRIDFISKLGIGTTMYFELPELSGSETSLSQPASLAISHAPCILIVEDDPDVAALLQRMLIEAGFNSDIAYNATQARELLKLNGKKYKAMTLDIMLPDEDGLDMLHNLRSDAGTLDLPVIVVSVKADEARRELNGGAVGILDWLSKPIDQNRLRQAIRMAAGPHHKPRVLHVEDEQDVHRVVNVMLRNECELVWTTTLSASREALETEEFDLVLLDIGLPDGSGLDLLNLIEKRIKPPRVVIFSAQDVDASIANRVNSVLVKSQTSHAELLDTIISAMRNPDSH
ncbi:MAG: PAS domain S-box protein [Gammaproteobacteria bacterium]|nr:PAS domain S-box protein [Gammaproteobacteria bacterium]MDH5650269.1 PAS domain S-box protein [Gammaproteobacteria bacterium]